MAEPGPEQMRRDVAAAGMPPHEFTIIPASWGGRGLHACITSISGPTAPPNPLAATVIAALGGPDNHQWLGTLGICGSKVANPSRVTELCGLIDAQRRLIQQVHAAARALT
jgi:hypothetical protein